METVPFANDGVRCFDFLNVSGDVVKDRQVIHRRNGPSHLSCKTNRERSPRQNSKDSDTVASYNAYPRIRVRHIFLWPTLVSSYPCVRIRVSDTFFIFYGPVGTITDRITIPSYPCQTHLFYGETLFLLRYMREVEELFGEIFEFFFALGRREPFVGLSQAIRQNMHEAPEQLGRELRLDDLEEIRTRDFADQ
jgi:hypothetical protein